MCVTHRLRSLQSPQQRSALTKHRHARGILPHDSAITDGHNGDAGRGVFDSEDVPHLPGVEHCRAHSVDLLHRPPMAASVGLNEDGWPIYVSGAYARPGGGMVAEEDAPSDGWGVDPSPEGLEESMPFAAEGGVGNCFACDFGRCSEVTTRKECQLQRALGNKRPACNSV